MAWPEKFDFLTSVAGKTESKALVVNKGLGDALYFWTFSSCSLIKNGSIFWATQQFLLPAQIWSQVKALFLIFHCISQWLSVLFFFFFFLANLKVYVCDFLHLHIYDHAHSAGSANYCCKSITEADINPLERLLGNGFSNRSFLYSSFRAVPLFFILHNKQNPLVSISFLINSPRCHFYILSSDNWFISK